MSTDTKVQKDECEKQFMSNSTGMTIELLTKRIQEVISHYKQLNQDHEKSAEEFIRNWIEFVKCSRCGGRMMEYSIKYCRMCQSEYCEFCSRATFDWDNRCKDCSPC